MPMQWKLMMKLKKKSIAWEPFLRCTIRYNIKASGQPRRNSFDHSAGRRIRHSFSSVTPARSKNLCCPFSWIKEGIVRYGFHGSSFRYATSRVADILGGSAIVSSFCVIWVEAALWPQFLVTRALIRPWDFLRSMELPCALDRERSIPAFSFIYCEKV